MVDGVCFPYTFWPSLLFKSMFGVFLVLIEFLVPIFILVFCYGKIVWILHKRINSSLDKSATHIDKFYVARKNTLKTFLLVALCYIICWSSVQTYYLMYNLGYEANWDGIFFKCSLLLAFGNCMINPFIYLFKYRDYQQALKICFYCCNTTYREEQNKGCSSRSISAATVNSSGSAKF